MITPHRLMNLNYSLVSIAAIVVECLIERGAYPLHKVLSYAKIEFDDITEQDIMLAVSFLYLLGKVDYDVDSDEIFLCGVVND
ncbi:hypothetical protein C3Y05_012785 [Aeromonas allosaccharophila]|jgi:hypothetical protein|uniref:hypothetical protein n=1 Tax=Aeromonas allosaccharophila TaxID=656 RepID=UPI0013C9E758|nr:hypothetical protein [Aeromonas allosaccharophila]WDO00550.1 hypothetical protein C3Y05_012785 [Aeromonas allosaccharophila]HEH9401791.1 hypothetical protein [Aeromonas sobria]